MLSQKQVQHLFLRAGFKASFADVTNAAGKSAQELYDQIFQNSQNYSLLDTTSTADDELFGDRRNLSASQKRKLKSIERLKLYNLNLGWLHKMSTDKAQLREKMTLFWHNHFACQTIFGSMVYRQNNTLRNYALGNFRTLLQQMIKDSAMLMFLNNNQNRVGAINENFAREFLELFTIGRGNYTEEDIKNAARAFTGWKMSLKGDGYFEPGRHDKGLKTFMGKTGNFNSDDIIDITLENKQTAIFISKKIYTYFVNDKINSEHVNELAEKFYKSDYEISSLTEAIFTSTWFYNEENIGAKIKSPVELLAGLYGTVDINFTPANPSLLFQRMLGQILFFPPNVAGWPGGKSWIDSSTIVFRLDLAKRLLNDLAIEMKEEEQPTEMGDAMMEMFADNPVKIRKFNTKVYWNNFILQLKDVDANNLPETLANYILQTDYPKDFLLTEQVIYSNRDEMIKDLVVKLMSLPEYQLC